MVNRNGQQQPGVGKVERTARLHWVPLGSLEPSPVAQRHKLNKARVNELCANLDLEQIGTPTVNSKGGRVYIIDGWHRIEALRQFGFHDDDKFPCWTYSDLTEEEEAERFLKLNNVLPVDAYSRFKVAVAAGRITESDIDRIVRAAGLRVTATSGSDNGIHAPGTLIRIYKSQGASVLNRAVRIVRDAYGGAGLEAIVIEGIAHVVFRYGSDIEDEFIVSKLANQRGPAGGVNGLLNKANTTRLQTGQPRAQCVAAAAVDVINTGRGKKITSWFKFVAQKKEQDEYLAQFQDEAAEDARPAAADGPVRPASGGRRTAAKRGAA